MHDAIDNLDEFADIPDNLSDLTQDQYPLIITFWKFLMMLDGSIGSSFFNKFYSDWGASVEEGVSKSCTLRALIQSKEVNFDKFSGTYWPHFNEKLTKNLDASTVFTQIISHIKGEIGSVDCVIGRERYVALSEKRFSSLSSAVRERVYDIFLEYEKKKRAAREFDLSDFVNSLHIRLNTHSYSSFKVDFIYIDEVQDLTVSQIALLKYVCNNFKEGFVFAGDTAQTIARGIDFRFEDIRSLFYKEFLSEMKGKEKETRLSDIFQLCQNFRTHIGVLRLSQSVIDLLYYFFPFSVDKLNPETSLIYGDAPVLLGSHGNENAITKIFGRHENSSGRPIEFGAEQVILVRDDSAKKEILEIVGKQALVLTIIDCKGLEFQDVLLYNFFGSSPLGSMWRVLYGYLENEDIFDQSMTRSYPRFDITCHYLLCSELKQLYVALTRTRQRLWICENDKEFCKPMFDYWKRLCLVQGTQLDTDFVEAMRTASTPKEWRARGIKLFNERQFEMARICFEKAGDGYNESWARAAGLVERAERHSCTNLEKAHTAFQEAADIYETIQMYDNAATCYIKMGNYAEAGTIYLEKCGTSRLENAGDCFNMIKCWQPAADAYFQANCFAKCTSVCLKAELFDAGLKYLERWRLQEEQSTNKRKFRGLEAIRDDYLKNCANIFCLRGDSKKMMHFVMAFKSMEEIRKFLMEKKLLDELLSLELGAGNFIEAARMARLKEDLLLEVSIWEKAGSFEKATRLVILAVIVESLWSHGSRGWRPKSFSKSEVYFTKAKDLAQKVSVCFHDSICSELYLWGHKPKTLSKLSNLLFEAEKCKNSRLTFLSLRSLLDLHLNHENSGYLIEAEPQFDLKKWFHEMMAQSRVSLNTLIHIWVQWRDAATEVSSSLCEFCLDYLGVRKDDNGTYCVLNPNASWIGNKVRALLKKSNSGWYFMASHLYAMCATSYWKSEIFSVGKAVVEKLDSLLRSYSNQTFCPETRGTVSLLVYKIIRSLKEIQSSEDNSNFLSCIVAVEAWFWDACFPWPSKNYVTEGVLSIIDCPAAVELLDELLDRLLGLPYENGKFTYGQLGKLLMILLLSGKLPDNQSDKIMQFTENRPMWQKLFSSLKGFFIDGSEKVSMVVNFQKALQATYDEVNWRQEPDYMSPHCYLYLLELLTFFASSCLRSAGYMITTRAVLAEIVKLRGCKDFLDSPLDQMAPDACLLSLYEFIVHSVQQLLCDRGLVLEWINTCSSSLPGNFYRQMVLRLAIILHMAYLNMSLDIYSAGKFLSSCGEISRILPVQFSRQLLQSRNSWDRHMSFVAFVDAFASVGDPLVIISQKEDDIVFPPSNFLFFCCDQMRDKDHIMSVLFPRSTGSDLTPSMVNSTDIPSITVAEEVTEATKSGQGEMDGSLVKMLEAFRRCEKASKSIMRSDSIKSGASEPSGSEIVFYKDNVTIHPKQYTSDRISGRLRLIKHGSDLLLTWVPYKPGEIGTDCFGHSDPEASDKDRNLYTIKASLSDVRSIRRHTPPLGWQYIIVVLSSGLAYPPLYFYSGGFQEFITTLKQHVFIIRSSDDPNVFLVNDFQDPLQKSLSSSELPGLASLKSSSFKNSTASIDNSDYDQSNGSAQTSSTISVHRPTNKNKQGDLSRKVLEKFSLLTRFARETTSNLFKENHGNQYPYEKFLEKNKSALNNKEESKHEEDITSLESSSVASDVSEFDRLPLVWGKQRESPLSVEEWTSFLDNDGRVTDSKALRKRVFYGGVEHELRKEVWKFLLGFYEYHSTYAEREFLCYEKEHEYQTIKKQWQVRTDRTVPFYGGDENCNVVILRDILLTYSFYNFDLGYCQGMSDLLSPILFVMENESTAFWCFVALMERLGPNFNRDQSGMHSQLLALSKLVELLDAPLHNYLKQADCLNYFFCFRWILIQFKREFVFDEIMRLWEVYWTYYLSEHFHLYMCVAVLKRYRKRIIGEQMDFDTLLKFINELSGHINLEQSLRDAEALCAIGGENGAALIPPGTPPSLPIETDAGLYVLDDEIL